jgi:tetratricopeptide (TPR) repeat protein
VAWAVEGSVRLEPEATEPRRLHVTSRLVRIDDEAPVWSARFDRELGEGLDLQAEIARAVAMQLGHALGGDDPRPRPTRSLEAWRAYVRGIAHVGGSQEVRADSVALGVDLLALAVERDPGFALAWAELSRAHSWLYHLRHDAGPGRCESARSAVARALELEPDLPRAHLALGDVAYRCDRDYDRALRDYERAAAARPGDPVLRAAAAYVQRRKGRFLEAVAGLEEALSLDPLSASLAVDLGQTHLALRNYDAARSLFDRAIEQQPDLTQAWASRVGVALLADGDTAEARALIEAQPGGADPCARAELELVAGDAPAAATALAGCGDRGIRLPYAVWPRPLLAAWIHDGAGESEATPAYRRARDRLLVELEERPDDFRLHAGLGLALAGLGDADAAVASGERALELFPVEGDALAGPPLLLQLAWIHARLGDDAGIDQVDRLLHMPAGGWVSAASVALDPRLSRLREKPGFRALVARDVSQ